MNLTNVKLMFPIWAMLGIYLLCQLAIGWWISRKIETDKDYFLAGQKLGLLFASTSIFATWFGAETCMGSSAAIYENGLAGGRSDPFGYSICLILMAFVLAYKLRSMSIVTLGDFFRIRYSPMIEKMAVFLIVPGSIIWAAAQIRAFGQVLTVVTPMGEFYSMTIGAIFVIAYTFSGGLMGDVIHDFIQGIILVTGLGVLLYLMIDHLGGVQQAFANIPLESSDRLHDAKFIPLEKFTFVKPGESVLHRMDSWMVPILGSLVAQELVSRIMATKSPKVAQHASLVGAALYFSVGLIPVVIGLLGSQIMGGLPANDQFLPALAEIVLPKGLYILLIGALVAAVLATVDSTLLTISAFITHNLMGKAFYGLQERRKVHVSRLLVVGAGIIAYVLALNAARIYDLIVMASSLGSTGVLVCLIIGLYIPRWANTSAAMWTMSVGLVSFLLARNVFEYEAPFMLSLVLSIVTYFGRLGFLKLRYFLKHQDLRSYMAHSELIPVRSVEMNQVGEQPQINQ